MHVKEKSLDLRQDEAYVCSDSVGIRTQDPQLRRLLLYPAELRNHHICGAKIAKKEAR